MRLTVPAALVAAALALSASAQLDSQRQQPNNNRPRREIAPRRIDHAHVGENGDMHLVARKVSAAAKKKALLAAKKKKAAAKKKVADPKAVAALSKKAASLKLKSQSLAKKAASIKAKSASFSHASRASSVSASKKAASLASAAKKASLSAEIIASKAASAAKAAKSIAAAKSSLSKAQAAASNSLAAGGVPAAVSASIAAAQKSLQAELASASSLASVHSVAEASLALVSAALASKQSVVGHATASLASELSSVHSSFASVKSSLDNAGSQLATSTFLFGSSTSSLNNAQGVLSIAQSALSAQGSAISSLQGALATQAGDLATRSADIASKVSSLAAAASATGLSLTCKTGAFLWRENCLSACPTDTAYVPYQPSGQDWSYCCLGSDADTVCTGSGAEDITACSSGNVISADGCIDPTACASGLIDFGGTYCCADEHADDCGGPLLSDSYGCESPYLFSRTLSQVNLGEGSCGLTCTGGNVYYSAAANYGTASCGDPANCQYVLGDGACCDPGALTCTAQGSTSCGMVTVRNYANYDTLQSYLLDGSCTAYPDEDCASGYGSIIDSTKSSAVCCQDPWAMSCSSEAATGASLTCQPGHPLIVSTGTCSTTVKCPSGTSPTADNKCVAPSSCGGSTVCCDAGMLGCSSATVATACGTNSAGTQLYLEQGSSTCKTSCSNTVNANSVVDGAGWCCADSNAKACAGVSSSDSTACKSAAPLLTPSTIRAGSGTGACGTTCGEDYFELEDSVLGTTCAPDCMSAVLLSSAGWTESANSYTATTANLGGCKADCAAAGAIAYAGQYSMSSYYQYDQCSCLMSGSTFGTGAQPAKCAWTDKAGFAAGDAVDDRKYYSLGSTADYTGLSCSSGLALAVSGACVDPSTYAGCYPASVVNGVCCPEFSATCSSPVAITTCATGYMLAGNRQSCVINDCASDLTKIDIAWGGSRYCLNNCVAYSSVSSSAAWKSPNSDGSAATVASVDICSAKCYAANYEAYGVWPIGSASPANSLGCLCYTWSYTYPYGTGADPSSCSSVDSTGQAAGAVGDASTSYAPTFVSTGLVHVMPA